MRPKSLKKPVILIGDGVNAIGVIRSLSYCELYLIYSFPYSAVKHSRYIKKSFRIPDLLNEPSIFKTLYMILNKYLSKEATPVLLTCCDQGANFLSKHKDVLAKRFIVGIDDWQILSILTDKLKLYNFAKAHGIEIPETRQFHEIDKTLSNLSFPVILKPRFEHFPSKLSPRKAIKVFDKYSLTKTYNKLLQHTTKDNILIQEYLTGPPENIFSFCSYSKKGAVLAHYTALNKIREFPLEFGVGTFAKTIYNSELEILGKKLITALNYTGISEIDFKKDHNGDKFKLLEINARFYAQNLLGKACGANLTYIYYKELVRSPNISFPNSYRKNTYWIDITRDMPYLFKDILLGNISLKEIYNFNINKKISALFCPKDPFPFAYELLLAPIKIFLNFKKIFDCSLFKRLKNQFLLYLTNCGE